MYTFPLECLLYTSHCVSQRVVMHFPNLKEDFTSGITNYVERFY